jgi:hypothetical protein
MPCSMAMSEVAVAFPNDEPSGDVIASRLRAGGIAARVDRGLSAGIWQISSRGQVTVLVDEAVAARAHKILGTTPRAAEAPSSFERLAVVLLLIALVIGVAAIVMLVVTR